VLLVTAMVMFVGARAGRVWGVDGWILAWWGDRAPRWLRLLI
jgi:hypothetical protein